jgi:hypothetical protein
MNATHGNRFVLKAPQQRHGTNAMRDGPDHAPSR